VTRTADSPPEPPHPRQTTAWFGHAEAERALLDAYRSGRMPHAWLIGGPPGIGKATLAYRIARFVLANPNPAAVHSANSLALEPVHPVVRRVAAQAHSDLLVLERTIGPTGTLRTMITVDEVRRTVSFFGSTAGEGGWRVCIVDVADELHPGAANALLKILEEPPARALFLIVSHAPGRLLATIRSRCRRLMLRALAEADVAAAAAAAAGRSTDDAAVREAAVAAEGSVARALVYLGGQTLQVRTRVSELLRQLPTLDPERLHVLGDSLTRADDQTFRTFVDALRDWLSAQLRTPTHEPHRLARVAQVWEKLDRAARDVQTYNLERKPMVFAAFGMLAEAARSG
jgi:DNA polymerase III subunit delta'